MFSVIDGLWRYGTSPRGAHPSVEVLPHAHPGPQNVATCRCRCDQVRVRLSGARHSLPQGDRVLVRRGMMRADLGSRLTLGEGERDASVQQTSPHGTRSEGRTRPPTHTARPAHTLDVPPPELGDHMSLSL